MGVWVAVIIVIIISIFLYGCIRVGAKADREMEKFFEEKDK